MANRSTRNLGGPKALFFLGLVPIPEHLSADSALARTREGVKRRILGTDGTVGTEISSADSAVSAQVHTI